MSEQTPDPLLKASAPIDSRGDDSPHEPASHVSSETSQAASAPLLDQTLRSPLGFIGGRWVRADSGKTFDVIDPCNGQLLAQVPQMGQAETLRAIEAAHEAAEQVPSLGQRRRWLSQIAQKLLLHRAELGRLISLEQGKPLKQGMAEVRYAAGFFGYYSGHLSSQRAEALDQPIKGAQWWVHQRPAGVAAAITPWNFPLAMLAKKVSAALGAGCSVVAKPAELTPLSAIALGHLMQGIGVDAGRLNLVFGDAPAIGQTICEDPRVAVLSFTGSTATGRLLMRQSAATVKRVLLELGGNAPFIVMADADLDAAVNALIANKFRANGQTCVCANRVYAHKAIHDAFAQKLTERVGRLKLGNPLDEETDVGPLIHREGFDKVAAHVQDAISRGAKAVLGGSPKRPEGQWGAFFEPTILVDVPAEARLCSEETFGPVIPIRRFEDTQAMLREANGTMAGLAAYLFTGDLAQGHELIAELRFGHVGLNTATGPTPEAPFGGMKQSGIGREGGRDGLLEFCETQTVAITAEGEG